MVSPRHPRSSKADRQQVVAPPDPGPTPSTLGREFTVYIQADPTHRFLSGLVGVVVGADDALDGHLARLQDSFLAEKALRDLAQLGAQADSLLSHPSTTSTGTPPKQ